MAYTVNQNPRLQIGDAQLGSLRDRVALIWQTTGSSSADSFVVEYRPANSNGSWQTASTPTTLDTRTGGRLNHSTNITGLDYSSEYEYRVQHFRNGSLINTYQDSFETRLAAGDDTPFTFAAYGDSAYIKGNSGFREVQGQINQSDAKFALLLGDNAYNSGTHSEFDARFTTRYAPEAVEWSASHIDYGAIGNHESYTQNGQPYLDSYVLPEFDNAPVAEKTYSFDYGNVHFATIDTNTLDSASALERELKWLEEDLKASDADWKIVFAHHPVAGVPDKGEDPGDNYYRQMIPTLNDLGVDLLLTGHSHTYGWTYPLTGYEGRNATFVEDTDKEYAKGAGVVQVVSGMGGKSIRSGSYNNFPFVAEGFSSSTNPKSEHGYSKVSVTEDRLTIDYVAADNGEVLDSFSIYNDPNSPPVDPPVDPPTDTMKVSFEQGVDSYSGTVDTMLQEASPTANNSNATSLNVDTIDDGGAVQGLIRFEDIFGNQAGQIGSNTEIVSAQLELDVDNQGNSLEFYRMAQDWSDNDTWNSLGNGIQANGTEALSTADATTGEVSTGLLSVDVTDSIKAWQNDPNGNFGWAILPTGSNGVDFDSAEGATKPRLVVEYKENDPAEPPKRELAWEDRGLVDEAAVGSGSSFDLGGGLTATVNWDTKTNGGNFVAAGGKDFVSYEQNMRGGDKGYLNLGFDNDARDPNDLINVSLKFNQAVTGLSFSVLDVDSTSFMDDAVEIYADGVNILDNPNASYTLGGNSVKLDNESYMKGFEGRHSAGSGDPAGNIKIDFGSSSVSEITISYFSTDDNPGDPNDQSIGISDLTWTA